MPLGKQTEIIKICIENLTEAAGSSTLISQYIDKRFLPVHERTTEPNLHSKQQAINKEKIYRLSILERGYVDVYKAIRYSIFQGASAYIICVDAQTWTEELNPRLFEQITNPIEAHEKNAPFFIIINKIDLIDFDRKENIRNGFKQFSEEHPGCIANTFFCSARTGENIDLAFEQITQFVHEKRSNPELSTKEILNRLQTSNISSNDAIQAIEIDENTKKTYEEKTNDQLPEYTEIENESQNSPGLSA